MNFLMWVLFLAGVAVKSEDSNKYYVIQMPEEEPRRTSTKAFRVFWNVPTMQCKSKGIPFENLYERFGIIQNDHDSFRGEKVSILYDPGLFPALLKNESTGEYKFRNGGVPQEGDLEKHAQVFRSTLEESVPDPNFSGIGIIDFESWRPIFRQNFGVLTPYKDVSYQIERKKHWIWPESWIKAEAKQRFEEKARMFMHKTLSIAREMRPRAQWGYYGFPYCFNMAASNMRERCADRVPAENNEIYWLWLESTALYPSVYSPQSLTTPQLAQLVRGRVREAARVRKSGTPILPYFWFRYHSQNGGFLSEDDLQTAIKTMYESEASGFILWGSSNDVNTVEKCKKLLHYIENQFGPEVAKYTKYDRTQSMNDVGSDSNDITSSSTETFTASSEENPAFEEFVVEKTLNPKNESQFDYYEDADDLEHNKIKIKDVNQPSDSEYSWLLPQNYTRIIKKHFENEKTTKDYLSVIDITDKGITEELVDDLSQPPLIDIHKLKNDEDLLEDTYSVQSTTEDEWNYSSTTSTDSKSYELRDDDDFDDTTTQSYDKNKLVDVIPIPTEMKLDQSTSDQDLIDTIPVESSSETKIIESITTSTEKLPSLDNIVNVETIDIMDETEKPVNLNNFVDFDSIGLIDEDLDTKYNFNAHENNKEKQDEFKLHDEIISKEYDPDKNGRRAVHKVYEVEVFDKTRHIPDAGIKGERKIRKPLAENTSTVIADNISTETNAPQESTTIASLPATFDLIYSSKRHFEPRNIDTIKDNEQSVLQSDSDNLSFIEKVQTFNDSVEVERTVFLKETNYKQENAITNLTSSALFNGSYTIEGNALLLSTEKSLSNTTPTTNLVVLLYRPLNLNYHNMNVNQSVQPETKDNVKNHDKNSTKTDKNISKLDVTTKEIVTATELTSLLTTSTKIDTIDDEIIMKSQMPKVLTSEINKKGPILEIVSHHDENVTSFDKSLTKLDITTTNVENATELTTFSTTVSSTSSEVHSVMMESKTPKKLSRIDKNDNPTESIIKHDENTTGHKNFTTYFDISTAIANTPKLTTLSTTPANTGTNDKEILMESQNMIDLITEVDKNVEPIEHSSKHEESRINFDKNVTILYVTTEEIANATEVTTSSSIFTKIVTKDQMIAESKELKSFVSEVEERTVTRIEGLDAPTKYSKLRELDVPILNDQVHVKFLLPNI